MQQFKNLKKKFSFVKASVALMAVMVGCDKTTLVTSITINPLEDVRVEVGKTTSLSAIVLPDNATNKNVTWSSGNTGIATVNAQTGVVTGVGAGTATIRATAADDGGASASKNVTVTPLPALTVSLTTHNFAANGGISPTISITSNQPWTVSSSATWLTTSSTSGSNNGVFTMTATANTSSSSRSATVTVTGGVITRTIDITQSPQTSWNIGHPGNSANVTASLSGNTLTISGIGQMVYFSSSSAPWRSAGRHNDITTVVIQSGVTNIGNNAFNGCEMLSTATIGASVQTIGSSAFNQCRALTSISIPNSVTSIGTSAFANCSSLATVTIENGPTTLSFSYSAFSGSNNIQTVHLGRNLSNATLTTGAALFSGKTRISTLTIGNNVTSIGSSLFYGCSGLTSPVTIPNSVEEIGASAFRDCEQLRTVNIGNNVKTIGNNAFQNCRALTAISIPNSVTSIEWRAFANCSSLATVTIENGPTTLSFDWTSFEGSNNIQTVHLGRNLSNATLQTGAALFSGKTRISTLTIGNNVTSMGNSLFYGCSGLTRITSNPTNPPTIQSDTFNGVTRNIPVYVPRNNVTNYRNAQHWNQFTNFQGM